MKHGTHIISCGKCACRYVSQQKSLQKSYADKQYTDTLNYINDDLLLNIDNLRVFGILRKNKKSKHPIAIYHFFRKKND